MGRRRQLRRVTPRTALELTVDPENPNKGTPRGAESVGTSIDSFGWGRSVVVGSDLRSIAGGATLKEAQRRGAKIRLIETDGDELIVHVRRDLKSTDAKAKGYAVADNQTSRLGLNWDRGILAQRIERSRSLASMFTLTERERLISEARGAAKSTAVPQSLQLRPEREYVVVVCDDDSGDEWEALKAALDLGQVRRGGYRAGSPFEAVGTARVVAAAALLKLLGVRPPKKKRKR